MRWGKRDIGAPLFPARINILIKRCGMVVAAALLWLLVPLRLHLFNRSPALILALGFTAIALGLAGPWKSAWCSSLCPLYPVEKLYGAAPVWQVADARCVPAHSSRSCFRCSLHCKDVPENEVPCRAHLIFPRGARGPGG